MVTRVSGTIAVGALFFALSSLLMVGADIFDDALNEFPPPKLVEVLFLAAPVGLSLLVNPLLFMAWYWILAAEEQSQKIALLWHILAFALAAILVATATMMLSHLIYMDKHVPTSSGQWIVNALITGGLTVAAVRAWKRRRPPVR